MTDIADVREAFLEQLDAHLTSVRRTFWSEDFPPEAQEVE